MYDICDLCVCVRACVRACVRMCVCAYVLIYVKVSLCAIPSSNLKDMLAAGGHIYKGQYKGWYSITDEAFVAENEVTLACTESVNDTTTTNT